MKKVIMLILSILICLSISACSSENKEGTGKETATKELPKAEVVKDSMFGVDKNINIETIDDFLGRDDTVYRDMRLISDPANYSEIGGEADLTYSIKGFKVVPYPFVGTLQTLPVSGAYTGKCLYTVEWNEDGTVKSAVPNYKESELALEDLFPKDKNILLTCGGGGYAGMTKMLLSYLGWDESKIYNIGGAWEYKGENKYEIMIYPEDAIEENFLATWRVDYAYIDFEKLHPVNAEDKS